MAKLDFNARFLLLEQILFFFSSLSLTLLGFLLRFFLDCLAVVGKDGFAFFSYIVDKLNKIEISLTFRFKLRDSYI